MKIGRIILLFFAIILLDNCKNDQEKPYTVENILMDNAMAAAYFHIVFREAEHAWAYIDSMDYISDNYELSAGKTMNCNDDKNKNKNKTEEEGKDTITVIIDYQGWMVAGLSLDGAISIDFKKDHYREVNGAIADISLIDFSINGQRITGESRITYQKVENSETDRYSLTLLSGSAIYENGNPKSMIISATISGGRYERTAGNETFTPDDDEWSYTGTMTGALGKDQKIRYTNTIMPTFTYTIDYGDEKETKNGTVYYSTECTVAKHGIAQIKIAGQPDITYIYRCSRVDYETVTHVQ